MTDPNNIKAIADVASVGTVIGALVGWLPSVAALLTIIWTALRIYEWFASRGKDKPPEVKT